MNKNPFATPAYTPQQPPLPPGPPPQQPAQPDYTAYWAAAAAQHVQQPAATTAYTPQWTVSQPAQAAAARPTPEQSALYANYGYGGQQNLSWQQRQPSQQFQAQPPPPVVQPPPPPPPQQPAYNPYQPQAGAFQQPYVPQSGPPQPMAQPPYQPQAPQPFQQPQQYYPQPQQQQRHTSNRFQNAHQTSPQQFPPSKRPRFENGSNQHRGPPPPQPQFQAAPLPPMQQGGMGSFGQGQTQSHSYGRGGGPGMNQVSGRGGFSGGRGTNLGGRGRGAPMGMNRGGSRGRGGSFTNMGGRGGGLGQGGGSFRGHSSNRGFGNRDVRRGGSFNAGGGQGYGHQQQQQHHHHQQNYSNTSSFRGRNQAFSHSTRGGRHDSVPSHVARETSVVLTSGYSSSGKKDENRRTLTDFKIVGLEIPELDWSWKASSESAEPAVKVEAVEHSVPSDAPVDSQPIEEASVVAVKAEGVSSSTEVASMDTTIPVVDASVSGEGVETKTEASSPPPPSRIRIYFHTPVSADDSHLLSQSSSFGPSSTSGLRKGKRKKLEDDDGDYEDGRGPPPPPPLMSGMGAEHDGASVAASADYDGVDMAIGRGSVAPSVAETASEADWLMAAIGEDEGDAEGGEPLHVSEVENPHTLDVGAYGNGYVNVHGDGHDDDHMMGDDDAQGSVVGPDDESAPSFSVPSGLHGPDGEKVAEIPSLNGFSSVSVGDEAHHQGDGPAMAPDVKLHDDGSQTLPDAANSSAHPASPSASRDVSAISAMPLQASPTLPDLSALSAGQNADRSRNVDSQAPSETTSHNGGVPLQATDSIASTAPDTNDQHRASPDTPTVTDGDDGEQEASQEATQEYSQEATQLADEFITDVFDDGETSPTATTLVTGSLTSSTAFSSDPSGAPAKTDAKSGKTPSANRLSVSYAAGTRRMVVDAEVVDKLRVFRAEGRIEVSMNISSDDHGGFKGILIEGYSEATASYVPLEVTENTESDPTVPPFSKATIPSRVLLIAYLDRVHPLSEARWVKSGDVQEWLRSIFGRMFWVSGDAADGWEKRIEIADPDPAPTIWNLLEQWAQHSANGTPTERQRFVRTHMTETDNILEILLRLARGERSTYTQPSAAAASQPVAGPLLAALSPESAHAAQQTHVSLAVLAIFRLAVEYAKKAAGEKGKGEAEERVGEIIRALPSHLLYKSLDGIFKEWRAEKKGGRT